MFEQAPKLTPDMFIAQIVSQVIGGVKKELSAKPVQNYEVLRQTPTGPVTQQTTLPQMLAELTDQLKVANEMQRYSMALIQQHGQATELLRIEMEEFRKLAQKSVKKSKRKDDDDDE